MTVTLAPVDTPPGTRDGRPGLAIVVAGLVVAGAVATILVVGYVPLPPMPPLSAQPDPTMPGTIAFVHGTWDDACVATVAAGGGVPVDLRCGPAVPESLAWTHDGDLAIVTWGDGWRAFDGPVVVVVDPATGEERDRVETTRSIGWAADRRVREDGARIVVSAPAEGEATLVVRHQDGTTTDVAPLTGPRDYDVVSAQWSPDGAWILAMDSRGRLFVVAEDGEPGPRLVAETGGRDGLAVLPAWAIDGQPAQRVDVAELVGEVAP